MLPTIEPCPFDAGEGTLTQIEAPMDVGFGFPSYCVQCQRCGASGPDGGSFDKGKVKAIKLWSRRE